MSEQARSPRWAPGLIHVLLDELAARYAGPAYQREITAARDEYFTRSGKVFEDDAEVHEARTISFLEWYVIERPLASGVPPIIDALEREVRAVSRGEPAGSAGREPSREGMETLPGFPSTTRGEPAGSAGREPSREGMETLPGFPSTTRGEPASSAGREPSMTDGRTEAMASLASSHRSLFDIAHADGNEIELEDVLGGARFRVVERRGTVGFEVGSIVEARVVWDGGQPVFAKTFLFHPRDARSQVLDFVDEALGAGTDRQEIMFHLAQLFLRWHRHGHSNAARIYKGSVTQGPVPL